MSCVARMTILASLVCFFCVHASGASYAAVLSDVAGYCLSSGGGPLVQVNGPEGWRLLENAARGGLPLPGEIELGAAPERLLELGGIWPSIRGMENVVMALARGRRGRRGWIVVVPESPDERTVRKLRSAGWFVRTPDSGTGAVLSNDVGLCSSIASAIASDYMLSRRVKVLMDAAALEGRNASLYAASSSACLCCGGDVGSAVEIVEIRLDESQAPLEAASCVVRTPPAQGAAYFSWSRGLDVEGIAALLGKEVRTPPGHSKLTRIELAAAVAPLCRPTGTKAGSGASDGREWTYDRLPPDLPLSSPRLFDVLRVLSAGVMQTSGGRFLPCSPVKWGTLAVILCRVAERVRAGFGLPLSESAARLVVPRGHYAGEALRRLVSAGVFVPREDWGGFTVPADRDVRSREFERVMERFRRFLGGGSHSRRSDLVRARRAMLRLAPGVRSDYRRLLTDVIGRIEQVLAVRYGVRLEWKEDFSRALLDAAPRWTICCVIPDAASPGMFSRICIVGLERPASINGNLLEYSLVSGVAEGTGLSRALLQFEGGGSGGPRTLDLPLVRGWDRYWVLRGDTLLVADDPNALRLDEGGWRPGSGVERVVRWNPGNLGFSSPWTRVEMRSVPGGGYVARRWRYLAGGGSSSPSEAARTKGDGGR